MQYPRSFTRFRCWSLAMYLTSFLNSWSPCLESFDSLFTAISCPDSKIPWNYHSTWWLEFRILHSLHDAALYSGVTSESGIMFLCEMGKTTIQFCMWRFSFQLFVRALSTLFLFFTSNEMIYFHLKYWYISTNTLHIEDSEKLYYHFY